MDFFGPNLSINWLKKIKLGLFHLICHSNFFRNHQARQIFCFGDFIETLQLETGSMDFSSVHFWFLKTSWRTLASNKMVTDSFSFNSAMMMMAQLAEGMTVNLKIMRSNSSKTQGFYYLLTIKLHSKIWCHFIAS